MLTDEEVFILGTALEDQGFSHAEIDEALEHHGVKGMHWGIRKAVRSNLANESTGSFKRTGKTEQGAKKTQTRTARNLKRGAAFLFGAGFPGLILYNALSRPVADTSKVSQKKQSGAAYVAKMVAAGALTIPSFGLGAVAYHQMASKVKQ